MARKAAKPREKAGRPSKYTPELGTGICALVESMGFLALAAERMGICRKTAYEWRDRGEAGEELYADFAAELRTCKARYESKVLKKVKHPEWLLERMDPELFGRQDPNTVVNVSQSMQVIPREQALAELRELAKSDPEIAKLLKGESDGIA